MTIAEFSTFFASPYCNRLLSDLGAEVIKVESTAGDPMRPLPSFFEGANRGKRGIAVDLKHPDARQVVARIVAWADVVQHNMRPGAAERLGIDEATLREVNGDVIYHYSPGYGSSGPKSMLQSFAPLLSGFVGQFAIGAGVGNRPHGTFGNEDYYNGLLSACAQLLALIHRDRTGVTQNVESPQLHSSVFTTSEFYKAGDEYRSVIPRLGSMLYGWSPVYRLYQCLDGWICVTAVTDDGARAVAECVLPAEMLGSLPAGAIAADAPEDGELAQLLEFQFVGNTVDAWVEALRTAGVAAEAVPEGSWLAEDSFYDDALHQSGRMMRFEHPVNGPTRSVGSLIQPTHSSVPERGRAPVKGEHTAEVLDSLGFSPGDVDTLLAAGAIADATAGSPAR